VYPTSDRYEVIKLIATGGMARVFLGRAKGTAAFERLVAMKVMHDHLATEDEYVAMFLDEARLAARIRHPNVVATLDVVDGDIPFLVMELVEGPTLRDLTKEAQKRGETIPVEIALRIISDALLGLHAAHELSDSDGTPLHIVHRDVSPQNVLVGNDGVSRLADFGVAKAEVRIASTKEGQMKGKLAHMAPEQLAGDTVDRRADIYAAGSMLWEVLTGQQRLSADNQATLVFKALTPKHVAPSEKKEGLPAIFDGPCLRAMALKPENRFPTTLGFADALEAAAEAVGMSIASQRKVAKYVESLELPELSSADSSLSLAAVSGRSLSEMRSSPREPAASVTSLDITTPATTSKSGSSRSALVAGGVAVAAIGVAAVAFSLSGDDGAEPRAGEARHGDQLSAAPRGSTSMESPKPAPPPSTMPSMSSSSEPAPPTSAKPSPTPRRLPTPVHRRKKRGGKKGFDPSLP
jgi:serine/threonine-protein kinase